VHDIGYRVFCLKKHPHYYFSERNIKSDKVEVLIGGEEEKIKNFSEFVRIKFPEGVKNLRAGRNTVQKVLEKADDAQSKTEEFHSQSSNKFFIP